MTHQNKAADHLELLRARSGNTGTVRARADEADVLEKIAPRSSPVAPVDPMVSSKTVNPAPQQAEIKKKERKPIGLLKWLNERMTAVYFPLLLTASVGSLVKYSNDRVKPSAGNIEMIKRVAETRFNIVNYTYGQNDTIDRVARRVMSVAEAETALAKALGRKALTDREVFEKMKADSAIRNPAYEVVLKDKVAYLSTVISTGTRRRRTDKVGIRKKHPVTKKENVMHKGTDLGGRPGDVLRGLEDLRYIGQEEGALAFVDLKGEYKYLTRHVRLAGGYGNGNTIKAGKPWVAIGPKDAKSTGPHAHIEVYKAKNNKWVLLDKPELAEPRLEQFRGGKIFVEERRNMSDYIFDHVKTADYAAFAGLNEAVGESFVQDVRKNSKRLANQIDQEIEKNDATGYDALKATIEGLYASRKITTKEKSFLGAGLEKKQKDFAAVKNLTKEITYRGDSIIQERANEKILAMGETIAGPKEVWAGIENLFSDEEEKPIDGRINPIGSERYLVDADDKTVIDSASCAVEDDGYAVKETYRSPAKSSVRKTTETEEAAMNAQYGSDKVFVKTSTYMDNDGVVHYNQISREDLKAIILKDEGLDELVRKTGASQEMVAEAILNIPAGLSFGYKKQGENDVYDPALRNTEDGKARGPFQFMPGTIRAVKKNHKDLPKWDLSNSASEENTQEAVERQVAYMVALVTDHADYAIAQNKKYKERTGKDLYKNVIWIEGNTRRPFEMTLLRASIAFHPGLGDVNDQLLAQKNAADKKGLPYATLSVSVLGHDYSHYAGFAPTTAEGRRREKEASLLIRKTEELAKTYNHPYEPNAVLLASNDVAEQDAQERPKKMPRIIKNRTAARDNSQETLTREAAETKQDVIMQPVDLTPVPVTLPRRVYSGNVTTTLDSLNRHMVPRYSFSPN